MGALKDKGRAASSKLHMIFRQWIEPHIGNIRKRTRYGGRMRLFKRWGNKHPKKVVTFYMVFVVAILGFNSLGLIFASNSKNAGKGNESEAPINLNRIADAGSMFNGMAQINSNLEAIQAMNTKYAETNIRLATKLDSLINLKEWSREDSLEICKLTKQLNIKTNP